MHLEIIEIKSIPEQWIFTLIINVWKAVLNAGSEELPEL